MESQREDWPGCHELCIFSGICPAVWPYISELEDHPVSLWNPTTCMKSNSPMGLPEGSTLHTYTEINPCSHNWTLEREWRHSLKLTFSHNNHWNSLENTGEEIGSICVGPSVSIALPFQLLIFSLIRNVSRRNSDVTFSHCQEHALDLWVGCWAHMFRQKLPMCFYCIFIDKLPNHQKTDVNRIWFITILSCLL